MGSETWHEPYEKLTDKTRDLHRAIVSLMEELEAIDWYQQRVDVTPDEELKAVLAHNRDEEIEHAMMNLEWIRRNSPKFDENMRTYLFSEGPITAVEESMAGGASARGSLESGRGGGREARGGNGGNGGSDGGTPVNGSLGIGSLNRRGPGEGG